MMKKFLVFLICALCTMSTFAQTTTNADGSIKYRGNVAIMVTSHFFTFKNGTFEQQVNNEVASNMKSAFNALAIQKFGNSGFAVVNRDGEAYANLQKIMEEQKLEDYIDGFTAKAKGQGADCLFLCDITTYVENDFSQTFISCRFIDIATNRGYHYSMKSEPINMNDAVKQTLAARKLVSDFESFLYKHILDVYPERFGIAKANGKKLQLVTYQPSGRILNEDKFYAFKWSEQPTSLGFNLLVFDPIGVATFEGVENGYPIVKSNKAIEASQDIMLYKNQEMPVQSTEAIPCTFFALTYDSNTYEGLIKNRINNAVYDAITRHPGLVLIEQEHLPELKKERELQKTEDFIDGHTVQQMKAIGALYMIHLQDFKINGTQVSFKLSTISVGENKIVRTVDVITSIDNIENEMYKQICLRFGTRATISIKDSKSLEFTTAHTYIEGVKFVVEVAKPIKNPLTGEVSYSEVDVCNCTVSEYHNNKFIAQVTKVLSNDDYKNLAQYSAAGSVTLTIDGSEIKTDQSTTSDLQDTVKKEEKKEKRKKTIGSIFGALSNSVHMNVGVKK